jgi:3-oxoacyl-[acyl-carrier-protein] synthase II
MHDQAHPHAITNGASPRRIVITGLGGVTPLGLTMHQTWAKLQAGVSGIDSITRCDTADLRVNFAGEVRGFDPGAYMDRKEARRLDPCIQYALAAAQQAVADAHLTWRLKTLCASA